MATTARHAAEALALRRLAVNALTDRASVEHVAAAVDFSRKSWALFLKVEQCAAAFRAAIAGLGAKSAADTILDDWVRVDTQRALLARGQLANIAAIAMERSWPIVVLKGATVAALGRPIHLVDLDVLVREEHALGMAAELSARRGVTMEGRPSHRHLMPIVTPDALPVEIHINIDNRWTSLTQGAWTRIVPLDGVPGLWRLAPRDHALHMLTHVVIDHADRRGRLRDTLLIGSAFAECSPDVKREIEKEIAGNLYAGHLADQLAFANGLVEGKIERDPFESVAFSRFWLVSHQGSRPLSRTPIWRDLYPAVWLSVVSQVAGWSRREQLVDGLRAPSAAPSGFPLTAWFERHAPPLGKALRIGLRATLYALTHIIAWPVSLIIRRDARRAGVKT